MPTIQDLPPELRHLIATYLNQRSFKHMRLSNRQLCYGTFPDLLERGSREKRFRLDWDDLFKMNRLLHDEAFTSKIDVILLGPTFSGVEKATYNPPLVAFLAKIQSTYRMGRPMHVGSYVYPSHTPATGRAFDNNIDHLGGCLRRVVVASSHELAPDFFDVNDTQPFAHRYTLRLGYNTADPGKKKTVRWSSIPASVKRQQWSRVLSWALDRIESRQRASRFLPRL